MSAAFGRLRMRLAVFGLVGVVTPLLVLLAVAAWTTEEVNVSSDGSRITTRGGLSAWIPVTVALLVVPAALVTWWWAGREVALHAKAARAVDEQRRLIEDTSHRLRTPIAVLLANADVALADPQPTVDELIDAVRASREAAAGMQRAVEGLLSEARVRRLDGERSVDVTDVVAQVCRAHASHAATKQVAVRRTGPGHLTAAVDALALERAIDAIVDNAVRHAPPATDVVVSTSCDDCNVTITITDDGPGIAPEHRARIFERYWTTDAARNGIGLDIVAEAARDAFTVAVESPRGPDGGTRFTMTIGRRSPGVPS
jgi:signal transduction histidine kinase